MPFLQPRGSYPSWVKLLGEMAVWESPVNEPDKQMGSSHWSWVESLLWSVVGALFWVSRCWSAFPQGKFTRHRWTCRVFQLGRSVLCVQTPWAQQKKLNGELAEVHSWE